MILENASFRSSNAVSGPRAHIKHISKSIEGVCVEDLCKLKYSVCGSGCVQLSWDQGGAKKEIQESVTKVRHSETSSHRLLKHG